VNKKETLDSDPKFMSKYHLDFLLLADCKNKTIKAYESYGDKGIFDFGMLKKTYMLDKYRKSIVKEVKSDGYKKILMMCLISRKV
jgi:peroxiredoxin